jgi:heterodisulfide reductase subunit B
LSKRIIQAAPVWAEVIAVACPLCHTNLDARQFQMKLDQPTPILYFTQLMAIAFGLAEKETALNKNLVDHRPLFYEDAILKQVDLSIRNSRA